MDTLDFPSDALVHNTRNAEAAIPASWDSPQDPSLMNKFDGPDSANAMEAARMHEVDWHAVAPVRVGFPKDSYTSGSLTGDRGGPVPLS